MVETLVAMIEKGKGPVLGNLRTMQLTEANVQLTMSIFVNIRNKEIIETDERVSKRNYGSSLGCSIEDSIL